MVSEKLAPSTPDDDHRARAQSREVVHRALRWEIGVGTWPPGAVLPNERELAETFGVGRSTLRAALHELRGIGLLVTTRGRHGGTRVAEHPPNGAALTAEELQAARDNIVDNFRFRRIVEPAAAELAATNATADELASLHALMRTPVTGVRAYRAVDSQFHIAIAAASRSRLLQRSVEQARFELFTWADSLWLAQPDWSALPVQYRDFASTHRPIAAALDAHDPAASAVAVVAHLDDGERSYLTLLDELAHHGVAAER